jgi:hypothetical protein
MACNCGVDYNKLRQTNAIWNQSKLGTPKSVGYLIEICEREQFYGISDFKLWFNINRRNKLKDIAEAFSTIANISLYDALMITEHHIICEVWIGWDRESRALQSLQTRYPKYTYSPVTKEEDYKYAVDIKVSLADSVVGYIQVKPKSWQGNADYLITAKDAMKVKHNILFQDTGLKCIILIDNNNNFEFI